MAYSLALRSFYNSNELKIRYMRLRNFRLILTLVVVLLSLDASAQNIDNMRSELAVRAMDGTYVGVEEDDSTKDAIRAVEAQRRPKQVNGYRIVIFSDHGQYAGDNAKSVLANFRQLFPYINAYLVYESPYFKISVGDCVTMEEAQILMAKVVAHYPKAFPKRETIKLSELENVHIESELPTDSLTVDAAADVVVMEMIK